MKRNIINYHSFTVENKGRCEVRNIYSELMLRK